MRKLVAVFWMLATLAPAASAEPAAENPELKTLQGSWKMVSLETKDKKYRKDELFVDKIVIAGADMTTHLRDGNKVMSTIKPNGKADPHEWDATVGDNVFRGIYKIDGDTLTICSTGVDSPRPKKFDVKETEGSGGLSVYQRIK